MRINHQIRAQQVRLIGEKSEQLGIKTIQEALALAQEMGKDLVEIAPMATPPVCKIIDFTKLRYEQEKKAREAKKKQKGGHLKEIRMRPNIGEHDLMIKLNHAKQFLEAQDKVRFTIVFKGRENTHRELGNIVVEKIKETLAEVGELETRPFMLGTRLMMGYSPKKTVLPAKKTEEKNNQPTGGTDNAKNKIA